MSTSGEITQLLAALSTGEDDVMERLFPLVYEELRDLARRQMRGERGNHTLGATALVHEAYLKLVGQDAVDWQNRAHFLSVAAMAMRRILINHARAKSAQKRGGGAIAVTFDDHDGGFTSAEELLALDEALTGLAALSERQARVVEARVFGGLTEKEIAEIVGTSIPTVRRDWRAARAYLARALRPGVEP